MARRAMAQKPRMEDVARHAGVALGTVSNALNSPQKVRPATLARVQRAIAELGFVPDGRARALAAGTSNTLGFVIVDLSNTFFLDMARGAELAATEAGMNVLLANADLAATKQDTYLTLFEQERVGGLLVAPVVGTDESLIALADRRNVVALNHCPGGDLCCVTVDNELGGYLAARHLVETGRRRLLFAEGPDRLEPLVLRQRGVERAVAETNGAVDLRVLPVEEVQVEDGRRLGHRLVALGEDERPDGIIAPADLLALGIEQTLLASSPWRIPADVALIGYDNNRAAWDNVVPISTIAQPGEAMGRAAARLLIEEIRGGPHEHRHVVLEPELIVRASSRAPERS